MSTPGITVTIVATPTAAGSSVSASGSIQHVITPEEMVTFGITEDVLKAAVAKNFGQAPDDAFLCSPTPWNDLYNTYKWPQVETVLTVKSATILGITSQPTIIATKTFRNNSSKDGTFSANITQSVTNTTETNWSNTSTLTVTQMFKYSVSFLGAGGGGETSLAFSQAWQQGGSESQSVNLGESQGISVDLKAGESVNAQLTASKGTMQIRIVYQATLIGDTAINYGGTYKGHHFYALPILDVMSSASIPTVIEVVEDINVGFFTNSDVELLDPAGRVNTAPRARVANAIPLVAA